MADLGQNQEYEEARLEEKPRVTDDNGREKGG